MKSQKGITALKRIKLNAEKSEAKRMGRLKEAVDNKTVSRVAMMWANSKITPKILSKEQRMAIHLMTDFVHNFTDRYIYTRLGISPETYHRWRNDPVFIREVDKEITRRTNYIRLAAMRNVNRAVARGSMKDTWNYLKMIGQFKDNTDPNKIDRTGEMELDDEQLDQQIVELQLQLANGPDPSLS